jgi:hypothetical protein
MNIFAGEEHNENNEEQQWVLLLQLNPLFFKSVFFLQTLITNVSHVMSVVAK